MALEHWLDAHPKVRDAIRWQKPDGSGSTYEQWSAAQRGELADAYAKASKGHATGLADPPPNLVQVVGDDWPTTVLSHDDAWRLYVTHVAQSLAVEIDKRFAWSLTDCSSKELAVLLDSRQFFKWHAGHNGYSIEDSTTGLAVPAAPDTSYGLIEEIRATPEFQADVPPAPGLGTPLQLSPRAILIAELLGWCRDNMTHFAGLYRAGAMQATWQYSGMPPVARVISGTHNHQVSAPNFGNWTAGCYGTVGFLRAVLRTANVPVACVNQSGHNQPYFITERSYLSHGDDPYSGLVKRDTSTGEPPYAVGLLLIGHAEHDAWYGKDVPDEKKYNNVGRRPVDLAIPYLPLYLLYRYLDDQAAGLSHADGKVYNEIFKPVYTLSELNAAHLWKRMDEKIATVWGSP